MQQVFFRRALVVIGVFALIMYAAKVGYWFWPYAPDAMINETGLLLLGLLCGLAVSRIVITRYAPWRILLGAGGLAYGLASSFWLAWYPFDAAGIGTHDHYVFSTPACEFAARFERPPRHGRLTPDDLPPGMEAGVALLTDVGALTSYRADCLAARGDAAQDMQDLTEAAMTKWTESLRLGNIQRRLIDADGLTILAIDGSFSGSALGTAAEGARTLASARSYIGRRSVMTLLVLQSVGEEIPRSGKDFLESGHFKRGG